CFCVLIPCPRRSVLFPYPTLFRSARARRAAVAGPAHLGGGAGLAGAQRRAGLPGGAPAADADGRGAVAGPAHLGGGAGLAGAQRDRKSTRLNSSHVSISYAVFCLK